MYYLLFEYNILIWEGMEMEWRVLHTYSFA